MIEHVLAFTLPAAYALLPPVMTSPEATAMLLAIGLNESRFRYRRQINGPARGFWQFEAGGGVRGVLEHPQTRGPITAVLNVLQYDPTVPPAIVHLAIEHNDTLAACFARCLLWTSPIGLPGPNDSEHGWMLYLDAWRPGKPHHETWQGFYQQAWSLVLHGRTIPKELKV